MGVRWLLKPLRPSQMGYGGSNPHLVTNKRPLHNRLSFNYTPLSPSNRAFGVVRNMERGDRFVYWGIKLGDMKLVSQIETVKTPLVVGSKVTFIGNLPGGHFDNYSGYSRRGSMFGTVIELKRVNALVQTKVGQVFEIRISELTNIEDLF
jgi:hypothetical protein